MPIIKQVEKHPSSKLFSLNNLILSFTVFFVIFAIWFPFGFSLIGLIEEWGVLESYISHGLFFIATPWSPLAAHALRPLTIFPHSLAYFFDPNSFNVWHILLMLSLLIKGLSLSYLIKKVTGSSQWACLAGILLIVYPADTMQLSFRSLHINWSLALLLLASCSFIAASQKKQFANYFIFCFLTTLFFVASLCMYEAGIALLLLPLLVLYTKEGFWGTLTCLYNRKMLIAFWIASFVIYAIFTHYTAQIISSYETSLVGERSFFELFVQYYPKLFTIGTIRGLLGGWFDAARVLFKEFGGVGYIYLIVISTCIAGLFWLSKSSSQKEQINYPSKIMLLRLGFVGLLLLLLGYLPYILLPSHMAISQRTFLFTEPGTTIVWIALLMLMGYLSKKLAIFASLILIFIGLGFQLFQFHHYVQIANTQRSLLKNIVENYDGKENKPIFILDKSNQLNHTWMFPAQYLHAALVYMYGHPINSIEVCHVPSNSWQLIDSEKRSVTCIEHEDSWTFQYPNPEPWNPTASQQPEKILNKQDLKVITIGLDGTINPNPKLAEYRHHLLHGQNDIALRFRNILTESTWASRFNGFWKKQASDRYQWRFGDWWSLELPIHGHGWREAEWGNNKLYHKAVAWKEQKEATLLFAMKPAKSSYILRVHLSNILSERIRNSIQIKINNHLVALNWLTIEELEAKIPNADLLSGINTIAFDSEIDPHYYDLSFQLASISLLPNYQSQKNTKNG